MASRSSYLVLTLLLALLLALLLLGCGAPTLLRPANPWPADPDREGLPRHRLEEFAFIRPGTSFKEIEERLGPGQDIGSGLHVIAYDLVDGRLVLVGFADPQEILYINLYDPLTKTSLSLLPEE
jgi:hypothetical protein